MKKGKKKWLIALVAALTAAAAVALPPVAPLVPVVAELLGVPTEPEQTPSGS